MDRERALQLAMKLAAFDSKTATPNEVELAGVRLQKIMQEHNISMMDLQPAQQHGTIGQENTQHRWKKPPTWIWFFVNETARCFQCRCIWSGSIIQIIGDKTDAALARYFIGAVLAIDLAKMSWRALQVAKKDRGLQKYQYHAFHQSFFYGFASTITKRLHAEYDEWYGQLEKERQSQARALIIVKDAGIEAYVKEKFPRMRTVTRSMNGVHDNDALRRGEKAGAEFKLNKGVAGSQSQNPKIG